MARKNSNDYFKLIEQQLAYAAQASTYLCEVIGSYEPEKIDEYKTKMHEIEHAADGVHHDIVKKLMVEFMTPIDQEDILRLVQINDDITDAIDEVIMDLKMYHLLALPEGIVKFSKEVDKCVKALCLASTELRNFKKPEKLRTHIIAVNDIEAQADEIYVDAIRALFDSDVSAKVLIGTKAVYESLENCCDLCEHAADVIEQIIIKNT